MDTFNLKTIPLNLPNSKTRQENLAKKVFLILA